MNRAPLVALALVLAACGGAAVPRATVPAPMPAEPEARGAVLDQLGRRLHAALVAGHPADVMLTDDELRAVLDGGDAARMSARRAGLGVRLSGSAAVAEALDGTEYLGVCLQDAREEDATGPLGLRARGWTARRVLLAARRPGGRRVALWVDGLFLLTDVGFGALDLERLEEPRWEHSDLELAPCDVSTSLR